MSGQKVKLPGHAGATPQLDPAADPRRMRRIIAEDPSWNVATVPHLVQLCLNHLVENFGEKPILKDLPEAFQAKLLKKLDISMPIEITAHLISDEAYWERCCMARQEWQPCRVADYGRSWKRLYFERNLEALLEGCKPEEEEANMDRDRGIMDVAALSAPYIQSLRIRQLLSPANAEADEEEEEEDDAGGDAAVDGDDDEEGVSKSDHIDLTPVIRKLPNLKSLDITYGVKECGMSFQWSYFGMTSGDCSRLSRGLRDYSTLTSLSITRSLVGDSKSRMLCYFLMNNKTLKRLDLSHNQIADSGARALAKLLNGNSVIEELDLRDNKIRAVGAKALGKALSGNRLLKSLNIRLNRLEDAGGRVFFDLITGNRMLVELNISSNGLGRKTSTALCEFLDRNPSLSHLDISCNELGEEAGRLILEGLDGNSALKSMDMRLTKFDKETEYQINVLMAGNMKSAKAAAGV